MTQANVCWLTSQKILIASFSTAAALFRPTIAHEIAFTHSLRVEGRARSDRVSSDCVKPRQKATGCSVCWRSVEYRVLAKWRGKALNLALP